VWVEDEFFFEGQFLKTG